MKATYSPEVLNMYRGADKVLLILKETEEDTTARD